MDHCKKALVKIFNAFRKLLNALQLEESQDEIKRILDEIRKSAEYLNNHCLEKEQRISEILKIIQEYLANYPEKSLPLTEEIKKIEGIIEKIEKMLK